MRLLIIALTYLKQTFSSPSIWLFTLLMPMIFTVVLAFAMSGMESDDVPQRWTLLLADEDRSLLSAALIRQLEADPVLEVRAAPAEEVFARVEAGEAPAGLVIPAGFGQNLETGQPVVVRFYQAAQNALDSQLIGQSVQAALSVVEGMLAARAVALDAVSRLGLPAASDIALSESIALWETSAPLSIHSEAVTRLEGAQVPVGAAQSSPGMAVMYVLFLTIGGGVTLLTERENGVLRRLLVMPLRKSALICGKLLGIYLSALAQLALMVLFGRFVLDVNWGQSPLALTVMLLTYAFAATALGILVAALARTSAQANGLSIILIMALSALGGAWWPIEIVPAWMQNLARALPTYWGMRGFQDVVSRGLGLRAVLPEAGILLAFGLAFLIIGLWRFRWG